MKEKIDLLRLNTILPAFGLVVLLLLSPCKVRNFIQVELGIQQTEVTNKSQSTISNTSCSDAEVSNNSILVKEKTFSQQLAAISTSNDFAFGISHFSNNYVSIHRDRNYSTSVIPLYILYQNFKDYL